jgi:transposase-like protein
MRHEAGTSISEIARQEGVNKSLVKYWIDHAEKFLPQSVQVKRAPAVSRLLRRGELIGWKKFVQLISLDKKAIKNMDGLRRIEAAEMLKNILIGLAGRGGQFSGGVPEEVIELSEKKARFIVRDWFEKNAENNLSEASAELETKTDDRGKKDGDDASHE